MFGFCISVGTALLSILGIDAGSQTRLRAVNIVVYKINKMVEHRDSIDMSYVMNMMQQSAMMGEQMGITEGEVNQ